MPELPDIEVFGQHLTTQLAGKELTAIKMPAKDFKTDTKLPALRKLMIGARLKEASRNGKELFFYFKNDHVLAFHLMLHGRFYWADEEGEKKNTLLLLSFSNKRQLGLVDFQRQARLILDPEKSPAPDALSIAVNFTFWKERLQSKAGIKNLLLDQKIIRGIGNAYADEILWAAGISPFSIAAKIPDPQIRALAKAVPKVLKNAVKQIGKQKDIIGGEIRDFLVIHNATKKNSPTGAAIRKEKKGRVTYYTDEQQLFA